MRHTHHKFVLASRPTHISPHTYNKITRMHPVSYISSSWYLKSTHERDINMSSSDDIKGIWYFKVSSSRGDRCCFNTCVDEVRVDFVFLRWASKSLNSIFWKESCFCLFRKEWDDMRRNASTKWNIVAISDLLCCSFSNDESFFEDFLRDIPMNWAVVFYKNLFIDSSWIIASFDKSFNKDSR